MEWWIDRTFVGEKHAMSYKKLTAMLWKRYTVTSIRLTAVRKGKMFKALKADLLCNNVISSGRLSVPCTEYWVSGPARGIVS
jgi:hypothetical protein